MKFEKIARYAALVGLGWFIIIILLYFVSHKPFSPETALRFAQIVWQIAAVLIIISTAGGIGRAITGGLDLPPLSRFAVQTLLGLGILSTAILLPGSFFPILKPLLWVAWILLPILFFRSIIQWGRDQADLASSWRESSRLGKTISFLLLIQVGLAFLVALAPPLAYDALVYHLTMPLEYLRANRIIPLNELYFSGMPQITEILYTWAIAIAGLSAAPLLGWGIGVIGLAGLFGTLRHRLNVQAAWVGLASILAGYTLSSSLSWGYIDWSGFAFGWANLACLDQWRQNRQRRFLVLAAIFAGFALSAKYTGGILVLTNLGFLVWDAWRNKQKWLSNSLLVVAISFLVSIPWWIKNWLFTGNPFYPFFFHSAETVMDAGIRIYQNAPAWGNWQDIVLLPLRATYLGVEGAGGYGASIGPLLLGLGLFGWIGWRTWQPEKKSLVEIAAVTACVGIGIWAVGNQFSGFLIQTRMYYPLFPAFAVLAATGYDSLSAYSFSKIRLAVILNGMIVFVLCLNVLQMGQNTVNTQSSLYLAGTITTEEYLDRNLGVYNQAMKTIKELPQGSKVILLFEPRGLYCVPNCLPDDQLDRWKQAASRWDSPEEITSTWKEQGYTHLLYGKLGAEFMRSTADPHYTPQDWLVLDSFLASLPAPQQGFADRYILYSLP